MKISESVAKINAEIKSRVEGRKMGVDEFHKAIREIVEEHLQKDSVCYGIWTLRDIENYTDIAKLELDRTDDKRTRWNKMWKVNKAEFIIVDQKVGEMTIEQMVKYNAKCKVQGNIDFIDDKIASLYEEIEDCKEQRAKFIKRLGDMEEV